jgi:hypothetical protein
MLREHGMVSPREENAPDGHPPDKEGFTDGQGKFQAAPRT